LNHLAGVSGNDRNGGEYILHTVIEFGNEQILPLFGVLALRDIAERNTDNTVRAGLDRASADLDGYLAPILCHGKKFRLGAG
jgi:hypothetical protein